MRERRASPCVPMRVRDEEPGDWEAVRSLHTAAFRGDAEARLVDTLRECATPVVSLVAENNEGTICGHILFSPVSVGGSLEPLRLGLAPLGVLPAYQRKGIGSRLVVAGIERCRRLGGAGVVVVGSPAFYGRFGFLPAEQAFGLRCRFTATASFQAVELEPRGLWASCRDSALVDVEYHSVFDEL